MGASTRSAVWRHLLPGAEFAALPREGLGLELIRGEIAALPPAFDDHGEASASVMALLGEYVRSQGLGGMYAATGFLIAEHPDTMRAPDLAFIQTNRVPSPGTPGWVRVMPDLVAEVVSSGDRTTEVAEKVRMWLDASGRLVWIVYPSRRAIEVVRPDEPALVLHDGDQLHGYDVVPGFACPIGQVFA